MSSEAQQDAVLGALDRTGARLQIGDLARETGLPEPQVREGLRDLVEGKLVMEERGGFFSAADEAEVGLVPAVPAIETLEPELPMPGLLEVEVPDAERGPTEVRDEDELTLTSVFRALATDERPLTVRAEVEMAADGDGRLTVRRVEKILSVELG